MAKITFPQITKKDKSLKTVRYENAKCIAGHLERDGNLRPTNDQIIQELTTMAGLMPGSTYPKYLEAITSNPREKARFLSEVRRNLGVAHGMNATNREIVIAWAYASIGNVTFQDLISFLDEHTFKVKNGLGEHGDHATLWYAASATNENQMRHLRKEWAAYTKLRSSLTQSAGEAQEWRLRSEIFG